MHVVRISGRRPMDREKVSLEDGRDYLRGYRRMQYIQKEGGEKQEGARLESKVYTA